MKRTGAILLALALCLLAAQFACAEANPVARSGDIAAYVDGDGHLFLSGKADAINDAPADGIVAIDAYRVLYLSPDDFAGTQDLYMIDLESLDETLVAKDVHEACLADEDTAYYVTNADRTKLMRVSLADLATEEAYAANEPIDRLYVSAEGLVFQLVDQAGTLLYVEETDRFEIYNGDVPRSSLLADSYELYLTDTGDLYLKNDFNYTSDHIDSDVLAYVPMNGVIYYLSHTGSAVRLKSYDPKAMNWQVLLTPSVGVESQLTASAGTLYLLGTNRTVYSVVPSQGSMNAYKSYADLSGYHLDANYDVTGLRIEAMSGRLNVYAVLEEKSAKPDFSFIEFATETETAAPILKLLESNALTGEQTAWDALKPAPQYTTLSRGSRGDAVRAIQQPLKDLGYYDYYVDGIFGPRTEYAVKLLQADLSRPTNGIADADLQRVILSGRLSAYDPYVALARGNRGLRVQIMQERLRELGYLADAADGIFGPRTQKAVQLFQSENNLTVNNGATRTTLELLYSDRATRCSSYIDLYPGDTGYRVRELNNRLKELFYLESSVGSTYTSQTTSAVRVFQRTVGMRETGEATVAVQRALFAYNAPEAPGYITLRRGDENSRVERLQRRLKDLGYYDGRITGYFGRSTKEAVALFQRKVGLTASGVATVRTQQLLFAPDAPAYEPPAYIGTPIISVDAYSRYEDDIYYIADDSSASGYVTFSWEVEGAVKNFNVRITDANGNTYVNNDTLMTATGVSISTLQYDTVYTLEISAYSEGDDATRMTSASIDFQRIKAPEPEAVEPVSSVGTPVISIDNVARVENGVNYVQPGTITFHWSAEGNVGGYHIEIHDEGDNAVLSTNTSDGTASISSDSMNQGELYTLFVYAIPANGTIDDARVKFIRFSLPVIELPSPDPTPVPTPPPTPEPTPEATPVPETTEAPAAEPTAEPTPEAAVEAPVEEQPVADQPTEVPVEEQPVADQPTEAPVEEQPAEQPEPEAPVEEQPAAEQPEPEAPGEAPMAAPVIAFSPVADVENEVNLISGETVVMTWETDEPVEGFYVEVLDGSNQILAATETNLESLSAGTASLNPGEVYTLNVTTIPVGGTAEDGVSASAQFGLYLEAEEPAYEEPQTEEPAYEEPQAEEPAYEEPQAEEPAYQEPQAEEPAYQEPQTEEPAYEEPQAEEPAYQEPQTEEPAYQEPQTEEPAYEEPQTEEPAYQEPETEEPAYQEPQTEEPAYEEPQAEESVSAPTVTIEPMLTFEDGVTYVPGGTITMSWYSSGPVSRYYVELSDASNAVIASAETEDNFLSADSTRLVPGEIYTLDVTAIPEGGSVEDGVFTSALFCVYAEPASEEPAYEEPAYEEPAYQEPAYEEPAYEEPAYEEPAYEEPAYEEPAYEEPAYQEPAYEEPVYEEPAYEEPAYEEPVYEEPAYEEPAYEEPVYEEPEYEEPAYEEPEYDEPSDSESPWSTPIDAYSDPSLISQVQSQLVLKGMLLDGAYTVGTLDDATVQAVIDFQSYCAENFDSVLTPIDPMNPVIDTQTLALLMTIAQ